MKSEGIYLLSVSDEGKLEDKPVLVAKQDSPSYMAITSDHHCLVAVSEPGDNENGSFISYCINDDKRLECISTQKVSGLGLCHVTFSQNENYVIGIGYYDASVYVAPVDSKRHVLEPTDKVVQKGSGPNISRQSEAHTHSATLTPDGKYIIICDLGTDMLVAYELDQQTGRLKKNEKLTFHLPGGCGPRHMVFSPNGKHAYVACELSSELQVLTYDPKEGFSLMDTVKTVPDDFKREPNYPAAIRMTEDGRFLYVSNRGEDSIALFAVNPENGMVKRIENYSTKGRYPRDFILTNDEKLILAVNQESNNIVVYLRNANTGKLTAVDSKPIVAKPICLAEI